jgi:hypothetical protein
MTTNEYLRIEALVRGITVDELMDTYRGTDTEVGRAVQEHDLEWVRDFAEFCMRMQAQTEIQH